MSITKKACDAIDSIERIDLAIGYLRYEALRKLSPKEFEVLWMRAINNPFDGLVDELIEKDGK